jgi:hypothetical protein
MQFDRLKRREFITLLGCAAVVWPLAASAQQGERMRRIGVLMGVTDSEQQAGLAVFQKVLQQLGWIDGRNVRIDTRWAEGDAREIRRLAAPCALSKRSCRRSDLQPVSRMSPMGLGCAKTKTDLVVMPSGRQIFAFFCSERDHKPQNSGCSHTAQRFHTARVILRHYRSAALRSAVPQ